MSEFIRLQANGADAFPDASTENTYRPNGTSVENALLDLESNVNTLGGVAGEAKTLAEQNSVKIATAEQEISNINSSLNEKLDISRAFFGNTATNRKTYFTDIDAYFDGLDNKDTMITIENFDTLLINGISMGNRQFYIGWMNGEKNFGWCLVMSFGSIAFGIRNNSSTFTWTHLS